MTRLSIRFLVAAAPIVACLAVACGSGAKDPSSAGGDKDPWQGTSRPTEITHEACDGAGHTAKTSQAADSLSKAKATITHVYDGGREICWYADLNGDGKIDVYTYLDSANRTRRRESAYTTSKQIDEIALYKDGELDVVERETNLDGKLDTWDFYEGGKLVRRERDKTGDGRIDEWWTFEPAGSDNATIVEADTRTGRPDPAQTIALGSAKGTAFAAPAPTAKPDAGAAATPPAPVLTPMPPPAAPVSDAGVTNGGADAAKPKGTH